MSQLPSKKTTQGALLDSYLKIIDFLKASTNPKTAREIAIALNISDRNVKDLVTGSKYIAITRTHPEMYRYSEPDILQTSKPSKTKKPKPSSPSSKPVELAKEKCKVSSTKVIRQKAPAVIRQKIKPPEFVAADSAADILPHGSRESINPKDLSMLRDRVVKAIKKYRNGAIPMADAHFIALCAFPDEDY